MIINHLYSNIFVESLLITSWFSKSIKSNLFIRYIMALFCCNLIKQLQRNYLITLGEILECRGLQWTNEFVNVNSSLFTNSHFALVCVNLNANNKFVCYFQLTCLLISYYAHLHDAYAYSLGYIVPIKVSRGWDSNP